MGAPSLTLDDAELAARYDEMSAERQLRMGLLLVRQLDLRRGETALDIGCGTGLLAERMTQWVGPGGMVTGIDPLPLRIAIAEERERPNLRFEVGNAYDLTRFEPASFDVVCLNAVFHWLDDKTAALEQIRCVLKPGGRLGIATVSRRHGRTSIGEIRHRVLSWPPFDQYPEARAGGISLVDAEELEAMLVAAGFAVRSLETRSDLRYHPTPEAALAFTEASAFGNFLGHLPEELRAQARAYIVRELGRVRAPEGVRQEGARLLAIAEKSP